jgi:type II restriction enzyme
MKTTAADLARAILELPKNRQYPYIASANKGRIVVVDITLPEGPIRIKRYTPAKGETLRKAECETISTTMLWRVANSVVENGLLNIDRTLGASYNTRSALEALLAHTPQFYYCYPGRYEIINEKVTVKRGHKHLLWKPSEPHANGKSLEAKTDQIISEIPASFATYDSISLPSTLLQNVEDVESARMHAHKQIALYLIGKQLGFRTYIAKNDQSLLYQKKRLSEQEGIVRDLSSEKLVNNYQQAMDAALLIDCVWFRNSKFMPAVIEVEHSTGVTSGLTRMKNFKDHIPPYPTRYVIAAPDQLRDKVLFEKNKPQFQDLDASYLSYSSLDELFTLCQRRKVRGVNDDFLDCFMEK